MHPGAESLEEWGRIKSFFLIQETADSYKACGVLPRIEAHPIGNPDLVTWSF